MNETAPVPAAYRGLWRRRMLQTPTSIDLTTHVLWLQTGRLFVDLRVPCDRQPGDPRSLATQQGFAGMLQVTGHVLTWHRWLDFQPCGAPDVGKISWNGEIMLERGVLADYYEEWERIASWPEDGIALTLETEMSAQGTAIQRAGIFLAGANHFACAMQRPAPLPPAGNLAELIDAPACSAERRTQLLDCVIEFGHAGQDGVWRVARSTVPAREGAVFLALHGTWRNDGPDHFMQVLPNSVARRWRIVEGSPDSSFHLPA